MDSLAISIKLRVHKALPKPHRRGADPVVPVLLRWRPLLDRPEDLDVGVIAALGEVVDIALNRVRHQLIRVQQHDSVFGALVQHDSSGIDLKEGRAEPTGPDRDTGTTT